MGSQPYERFKIEQFGNLCSCSYTKGSGTQLDWGAAAHRCLASASRVKWSSGEILFLEVRLAGFTSLFRPEPSGRGVICPEDLPDTTFRKRRPVASKPEGSCGAAWSFACCRRNASIAQVQARREYALPLSDCRLYCSGAN
jgi:hypothetical protein